MHVNVIFLNAQKHYLMTIKHFKQFTKTLFMHNLDSFFLLVKQVCKTFKGHI